MNYKLFLLKYVINTTFPKEEISYFYRECTRSGFCNFMHLKPISRELRRYLYSRKKGKGRSRSRSRSRGRDRKRRSRSRDRRSRSKDRRKGRDDKGRDGRSGRY